MIHGTKKEQLIDAISNLNEDLEYFEEDNLISSIDYEHQNLELTVGNLHTIAETLAPLNQTKTIGVQEAHKFLEGYLVTKNSGYFFDGVIVSCYNTLDGQARYVVEHADTGMQHIFNEKQLTPVNYDSDHGKEIETRILNRKIRGANDA